MWFILWFRRAERSHSYTNSVDGFLSGERDLRLGEGRIKFSDWWGKLSKSRWLDILYYII